MIPDTIDTEALRRLADAATEGPWMFDRDQSDGWMVVFGGNDHPHGYSIIGANEYLEPANAEFIAAARTAIPALLDALAAAERRATRAEAQSAIRGRAVAIYRDRARQAEARIKAVRELHQQSALIRRIPRYMRQGHDDDQPFHYCTGCDGARYPCGTIRALDTTTTQETR